MPPGVRNARFEGAHDIDFRVYGPHLDDNSTRGLLRSVEFPSDEESQVSSHWDNLSTMPLKLIVLQSSTTNSPSILSEPKEDGSSYVTLTAETSLAPSTHVSLLPSGPNSHAGPRSERDRDSESIVTLASLSRRIRRRSIDTNCSLAGIPPASIMERLTVNPHTEHDYE